MRQIDIVLTEGFPVLSLALITEPLRVANRESLDEVFTWRLLSTGGGAMQSSSGYELTTQDLDERSADAVLLLSSYHPEVALTQKLLRWLKVRARKGALMGCVDTGALIFAEAGLLSKRPAAGHFEVIPGYIAKYSESMFVFNRQSPFQ